MENDQLERQDRKLLCALKCVRAEINTGKTREDASSKTNTSLSEINVWISKNIQNEINSKIRLRIQDVSKCYFDLTKLS